MGAPKYDYKSPAAAKNAYKKLKSELVKRMANEARALEARIAKKKGGGSVRRESIPPRGPGGARSAFVDTGLIPKKFLSPKGNFDALTKGGLKPTAGRVFGIAMTPEMINQNIDFARQNLIYPRDAALDEIINSPGATSYDMASAVPSTVAGIGDFLGSLVDFSRPAQGGGLEFNTGLGANWYNPTIGATSRLAGRMGLQQFGIPEELPGATHPTAFSDLVPNIPGSAQGGSWSGLGEKWKGVPEDLATIGNYAANRGGDVVDAVLDFISRPRQGPIGGGYAPPMAR
jgi:hypothetical protein